MKKLEFDRILDECLARLEAGVSIEIVLEDHASLSEELEPLLRAALSAWSVPAPDPHQSLVKGRNRLLAEVDRLKISGTFAENGTKSIFSRYSGQWYRNVLNLLVGKENIEMKLLPRLALYGLMTALIAGFFTLNVSASSMPGDPLYGIKLGWERTRLALTFDDDSRQELEEEFENERLEEVEELLVEGREEDVEFLGVIESKGEVSWIISGIKVFVDSQTELNGDLEVGDLVEVEAMTQADGSLSALEITGAGYDDEMNDDSDDDMNDDSDDDMDDDSDDDMDDDSDDDMDDDSDDDMDGDSDDDMDGDSDDDMDGDSDDGMNDDSDDDDESEDSSDEYEEEEEEEEDEESSDDES